MIFLTDFLIGDTLTRAEKISDKYITGIIKTSLTANLRLIFLCLEGCFITPQMWKRQSALWKEADLKETSGIKGEVVQTIYTILQTGQ